MFTPHNNKTVYQEFDSVKAGEIALAALADEAESKKHVLFIQSDTPLGVVVDEFNDYYMVKRITVSNLVAKKLYEYAKELKSKGVG